MGCRWTEGSCSETGATKNDVAVQNAASRNSQFVTTTLCKLGRTIRACNRWEFFVFEWRIRGSPASYGDGWELIGLTAACVPANHVPSLRAAHHSFGRRDFDAIGSCGIRPHMSPATTLSDGQTSGCSIFDAIPPRSHEDAPASLLNAGSMRKS